MTQRPAPHLDVVTDPSQILIPDEDNGLPVAGIAVIGVGTLLGLGLAFFAGRGGADATRDAAALAGAAAMLESVSAREQASVASHVRVIADDARIRTTLATPGMDAATLEDLLTDLRRASGLQLVGVVDAKGVVRAVVGRDALRGVDLSSSSLFTKRDGVSRSRLWAFDGRLVFVALAPVKLGYDELYLLGASEVDARLLEPFEKAFGATAGLVLDGKLARQDQAPALQAALRDGRERGVIDVDGTSYVVHRQALGDVQPPVYVYWVRSVERTGGSAWAVWTLALLVFASSLATCALTWRAR